MNCGLSKDLVGMWPRPHRFASSTRVCFGRQRKMCEVVMEGCCWEFDREKASYFSFSTGRAGTPAPAGQPHPWIFWQRQDSEKWQLVSLCEFTITFKSSLSTFECCYKYDQEWKEFIVPQFQKKRQNCQVICAFYYLILDCDVTAYMSHNSSHSNNNIFVLMGKPSDINQETQ